MANDNLQSLLSYHYLTGNDHSSICFLFSFFFVSFLLMVSVILYVAPLDLNPRSEMDMIVNVEVSLGTFC